MTVERLIELLQEVPSDAEVVLARDAEGNSFSPVTLIDQGLYEAETSWRGQFYEDEILGDEDYDQPTLPTAPAVCLWPVN